METFKRLTPQPEETVPDQAQVEGTTVIEPIQPPDPDPVAEPPRPQPVPMRPPQNQQMPDHITIPMQQFIQMQQQIQHAQNLKPLPDAAQTSELSKKCAEGSGTWPVGHVIETRSIVQTQNVKDGFVEVHQTLVLCVRCGASLAQIRGSLGM